jgi:rRNA maturation protein Nop10
MEYSLLVLAVLCIPAIYAFVSIRRFNRNLSKKRDLEMCPHCGEVVNYKDVHSYYDEGCSICHGTGQGNGAYTGDSGECTCKHFVNVCPHCGGEM